MQINKNTYLCRDVFQMWLATKRKTKADDKEYYVRTSGYYTTFQGLLDGYIRDRAKNVIGDSVEETLQNFASVEKELRSLARKLGKELDEK